MTMKVTRCEFAFGLTCKQVVERMAEIEAQNANLRELAADLYDMAWHEYPSAFEAAFADRMRKLGVDA